MAKGESRAAYFRDYRKRKREAKEAASVVRGVVEHVNTVTGKRSPIASVAPAGGFRPLPGPQREFMEAPPVAPVVPGGLGSPATLRIMPFPVAQPRRRRVKTDQQIRSYIAGAMMQHSQHPPALLHLLVSYIGQLQEEMKRETEDTFAERVCEEHHPGRAATGLYCRLCHDAEMAGRFGSLPGSPHSAGELTYPGEDKVSDEELLLNNLTLKPPEG